MIVFCLSLCSISVAHFTNTQKSSFANECYRCCLILQHYRKTAGMCDLAPIQVFVMFLFQLHHNGVFLFILKEQGIYAHGLQLAEI